MLDLNPVILITELNINGLKITVKKQRLSNEQKYTTQL